MIEHKIEADLEEAWQDVKILMWGDDAQKENTSIDPGDLDSTLLSPDESVYYRNILDYIEKFVNFGLAIDVSYPYISKIYGTSRLCVFRLSDRAVWCLPWKRIFVFASQWR